jgi:hypothetical protein
VKGEKSVSATAMAKRNDVSVRIDAELYRLARTVAGWRDLGIGDYLNEIIGPAVRRDLEKMNKEIERQQRGQKDQPEKT